MGKRRYSEEELIKNLNPYLAHADEVTVDPETVFAQVETDHTNGDLSSEITTANPRYFASKTYPNMIEEVWDDGRRRTGRFQNGQFYPVDDKT